MNDWPFVDYQQPARPAAGPRLAIVGEAPGAEEVRQGIPFAGRSGKLLNEALHAAGIERERCLVANVFRRQPPGNKVGHFFSSRARARKEGHGVEERWGPFGTSDWVIDRFAADLDHLERTLQAYAPSVLVALGRTPLWALTGENGITRLRGQPLPCRLVPGAEVVATYHPSFILRGQSKELPTLIADLRTAVARLAR
ncbi:uracil-DNA glycosylase [Azospirillum sp. ST 5-10]|uniref:uracil-DNA glycosylase n=1 Tax=unclassified Azospirillum TaxID=2630922 RepID=UPI003F49D134